MYRLWRRIHGRIVSHFWDSVADAFLWSAIPLIIHLVNVNIIQYVVPEVKEQEIIYAAVQVLYNLLKWVWGIIGSIDLAFFWGSLAIIAIGAILHMLPNDPRNF